VDKEVAIIGAGMPIIDGMGDVAIDITANNVTITGFNITNATYSINCSASGFHITNNTFWHDDYGIYWDIEKEDLAENYTVYGSTAEGNEFYMNTNNYAIYAYVDLDYDYGAYNATIGDISFLDNTFYMNGTRAYGIYMDGGIYVEEMNGGNISVGTVNMSNNRFYGGDTAIYFYGDFYELTNTSVNVGDFIMNDNTMLNQSSYGMYIDYYDADYWYGDTTGVYGNLVIKRNKIDPPSGADAIDISDYAYWDYFYDNASLTVGNLYIEDNEIDVGGEGIYVYYSYLGYEFYDNASAVMGNAFIRDNKIYNSSYGIDIEFYDFEDMYDNSSASIGFINISGNEINASSGGIYIYYSSLGYSNEDNSTATIGEIYMYDNVVNASDEAIYFYFEYVPYSIGDNSSLFIGDVYIERNLINSSSSEGIYIGYYEEEVGYDMYDNASAHLPNFTIAGNTIHSSGYGIYVYSYENPYDMYENSSIYFGGFNIDDNTIYSDDDGIYFDYDDFCYDNYGNSATEIGDVSITDNEIHSTGSSGITVYYEDLGEDINDNSKLMVGNVDIHGNEIDCNYGIIVQSYVYAYDSTTVEMGYVNITENEIRNCTDYGIYLYYYAYAYGSSAISIERSLIKDNIIDNCGTGIYVYADISNDTGATATLESTIIDGNTISNCMASESGIHIDGMEGTSITDNLIFGCDTGIYIDADSNHTTITGNTITRNDVGIYVYGGYSGAYENVDTQIHDNKIYGNDEYGLVYYIQGGATPYINATYNWWGSVNGPNSTGGNQQDPVHTSIFADGNGDYIYGGDVTDNIHFDPWTGITLYKGWNLITFSFINSMQSASDLMDAIPGCTVVTMWDNINQKYVSYIDGFGEDFELNNGTSYFVFLTGSVMTYIIGDVYQPTINMTLYPGYNLIGWPYPEYEPAEDIADNITHCIKIAKWNAQEQTWVAEYITALGSYNFDLLMGEGAFVFVSERTQWQVVPLPPVPP